MSRTTSFKAPPLEKWIHYNSTGGDSVDVNYGDEKPWIARIVSISFTPADGEWTNPNAFLRIETGVNFSYSLNSSCRGTKPSGVIIPISTPVGQGYKTKVYYRGSYHGTDSMRFSILDSTYEEVPLAILTLTMHIAEEGVAFLTN